MDRGRQAALAACRPARPRGMKVFLDASGCRLNQAEIDRLAQQRRAAGHQPVASPGEAGWTVIGTCAVTRQAERDSRRRVRHACSRNPSGRIAVTGCWATLRARQATALSQSPVASDQ